MPSTPVATYIEMLRDQPTNEVFGHWAALGTLSATIGRRVRIPTLPGAFLHPVIFILLLGPSGTGKTVAMGPGRRAIPLDLRADSGTPEGLLKDLENQSGSVASLCIYTSELSSLFKNTNKGLKNDLYSFLCRMYDCESDHRKVTQGEEGRTTVIKPSVSLVAGQTPEFLNRVIDIQSLHQGLGGRLLFSYFPKVIKAKRLSENPEEEAARIERLASQLRQQLDQVGEMEGTLEWGRGALKRWFDWYHEDGPDWLQAGVLDGPRNRRAEHLAKLSCLAALNRGRMTATMDDVDEAIRWYEDIEPNLLLVVEWLGGNVFRSEELMIVEYVRKHGLHMWVTEAELAEVLSPHLPPGERDNALRMFRRSVYKHPKSEFRIDDNRESGTWKVRVK